MQLLDSDYSTYINEHIWEIAPCGLVSTQPDGTILKCNTTFSEWIGVAEQDLFLKGKLVHFFTPGGKLFYEIRHVPLLNLKGSLAEIRYELVSEKKIIPVLVNSVVKSIKGQSVYLFSFMPVVERELRERELIEEKKRAEQMVRDRNTYISSLSHEIRTPLQVVNSIADLLITGNASPQQQSYISVLRQTTDTLLKLVNDLLNLDKLQSSSMSLVEEAFNLLELALDVKSMLKPSAVQKGLVLLSKFENIDKVVLGDSLKIKQVLTNLVSNAIKFTNSGQVELTIVGVKETINTITFLVSISDTGDGIEDKDLALIFQPYGQAESSHKNNVNGSGLGLDISRRIVELYGSSLTVKTSKSGTTFSFELTLAFSKGAQKEQMEKDVIDYTGYHALIVDDHDVNLMVFSHILNKRGIKTDVALNGEIAWKMLQVIRPDIIFVDLQMPVLDGMQLLKRIRCSEDETLRKLPVIAVSGDQLFDFEKATRENGLSNYLLKPYSSNKLEEILSFYLCGIKFSSTTSVDNIESNGPSFEKIKAITKGSVTNYQAVLKESARVLASDRSQFSIGLKSRNLDMIGRLVHKNKTISDYFNADKMFSVMERAVEIVQNPNSTMEDIMNSSKAISFEIDMLLRLIQEELNTLKE